MFAFFMIIVWPIGIPALFAWVLHNHRDQIVNRNTGAPLLEQIAPMRFLFEMYNHENYMADVYDTVRRIMLCGLITFMGRTPLHRASSGFCVSVLFTIVSREYHPFASAATNAMSTAAHWQINFTFLMNVVIASERFQVNPIIMGVVLVVINLFIFAFAFWEQIKTAKQAAELYLETEQLKLKLSEFQDAVHNIVTAQGTITMDDRRKFQSGEFSLMKPNSMF
jgi:hypothetical protein